MTNPKRKLRYLLTAVMAGLLFGHAGINAQAAPEVDCTHKNKYRSANGSCNNLLFKTLGASTTPFTRHLFINNLPDPRDPITGTDFNALNLPAPRLISNTLKSAEPIQFDERNLSLLFVFFGQFLAHDFADLHVDLGGFLDSGDVADTNTAGYPGMYYAPEDPGIFNLERASQSGLIVNGDVYLAMQGSVCKERFGSCTFENRITHFIDGSNIYGSDDHQAAGLRTFSGGL